MTFHALRSIKTIECSGATTQKSIHEYRKEEHLLFTPTVPGADAIRVIYAYPSEYTVGITSLGYQIVWALLASNPRVQVSRLFTDTHESLPARPELVGFSMSWELDYGGIMDVLEKQLRIPIRSEDRGEGDPLVFGGGPVLTANPEPFAPLFDVVLLGDGEDLLMRFIDEYDKVRDDTRADKLRALAKVPGVYVPALYEVTYESALGPVVAVLPKGDAAAPPYVEKQTYRGNALAASTVVTANACWESIYMVEVVRSCPEMCRFCLASYLTLPFRTADLEGSLIPAIDRGLKVTNRLGLLGASVSQHPEFNELLEHLKDDKYADVQLSMSSVRTNTLSPQLASTLASRQAKSVTVAVESGSERLRQVINKKLTNEEIIQAAINAKEGGLVALKLYGMVGIPGEEEGADLDETVNMMASIKKAAPGLRLTLGCSTFVPKAHTPFQWYGVSTRGEKRLQYLQRALGRLGVEFRPEPYKSSLVQAIISRGDRRLFPLLEKVRGYGDSIGAFRRAFKELKGKLPPLEYYVHEEWCTDQTLPWVHLKGPLPDAVLQKHLADARSYFT